MFALAPHPRPRLVADLAALTVLAALTALNAPLLAGCASTPPPTPEVIHQRPPPDDARAARYRELTRAANARAAAGDFAAALGHADDALTLIPFGLEAALAKVESHLGLGQRTQALDFAQRLADRHPQDPFAHYALGKSLYALGRLGAAHDAFADGLARAPDDRLLQLALLTALTHDPDVTLDELHARAALLGADPELAPDVLHALAMAHEIRGDLAQADALYVQAIAVRPHHPFAHYNLALLRHANRDPARARPHLEAFLDQAPPSAARERDEARKLLQEIRP